VTVFPAMHAGLSPGITTPTKFMGSAAAIMTAGISWSVRVRPARSMSAASGNANCSPPNPDTNRPPRTAPRASSRRNMPTNSRHGGAWLKLKRELATLDVVVTGVEYGNGRRAAVLSDYTFAIRDTADPNQPLKNVGKAYSGLTDQEIAGLTAFFKAHTLEDNGHFRTVEPILVLEVAFNNVMRSSRHASGFALRFPRILRIRTDKPVSEIDTLARVEEIYTTQPDKPVDESS